MKNIFTRLSKAKKIQPESSHPELAETYRQLVIAAQAARTEEMSARHYNQIIAKTNKISDSLKHDLDDAARFFSQLIDDENIYVRITASSHSLFLGVNVEKALACLKKISRENKPKGVGAQALSILIGWHIHMKLPYDLADFR